MKKFITLTLSLGLLTACNGGADSAGQIDFPGLNPGPSPVALTLEIKSGNGFECFALSGSVYCRGNSINADIAISSGANFTEYVRDADSDIVSLETWDDTICFSSMVLDRPYSGGNGLATYCIGEATLQNTAGGQPVIYGGPNFVSSSHGSSDLSYDSEPMMGADLTMSVVFAANMITDGDSSVTVESEDCTRSGVTLTCETFTTTVRDE